MFSLLIVVIYIITLGNTNAYECETYTLDSDNGGYIHSPNFPRAFPDGPYNCTYTIISGTGGNVMLEFTDLLFNDAFNSKYYERQRLYIYDGANDTESRELSLGKTYQISYSAGFVVRFEVVDTNLFKVPGFRAKYSTISDKKTTDWLFTGHHISYMNKISALNTYPKSMESRIFNVTVTSRIVIKAPPGHRLAYVIGLFDKVIGGEVSIQYRDGMTSESPLIQEFTSIPNRTVSIVTNSEYLYISETQNHFEDYSYAYTSFLVRQGECPHGYYKCASTDRCIGISAVCDGYDQCGDNSDEEHPSLNCSLPLTCDNNSTCYNNGRCYQIPDYMCHCWMGFAGRRCEYKIEGCPFNCINGGRCINYACWCNPGYLYIGKFYGDRCELTVDDDNESEPSSSHRSTTQYEVILLPVTLWMLLVYP